MKRGYLLPDGCKDLIDALRLKEKRGGYFLGKLPAQLPAEQEGWHAEILDLDLEAMKALKELAQLPAIKGELTIPDTILVSDLATMLKEKPFRIIAELMEMGIFANTKQMVGFEAAAKVARKHGFNAKRAV